MAGRATACASIPAVTAARKRAQAIAQGRGRGARVVIPLAFEVAARIAARPSSEFRSDPTQLTNALVELQQVINADGVVVALAQGMEQASAAACVLDVDAMSTRGPLGASLEACRRLRATFADNAALLAGVTGPATLALEFATSLDTSAAAFTAVVKQFCAAGADVVLVFDEVGSDHEAWQDSLRTAANIARFHQVSLLLWTGAALPAPHKLALDAVDASGLGIVTTAAFVAADADLEVLRRWVATVRG